MESPNSINKINKQVEVTFNGATVLISTIGGSKLLADWIWVLYQAGNTGKDIAEILNAKGFLNSNHRPWGISAASDIVHRHLGHTLTGVKKPRLMPSKATAATKWRGQNPLESEASSTMEMVEYACTLLDLAPSKRLEMVRRLVV